MSSSSRPSARGSSRRAVDVQMQFARQREREFRHQETWNGQVRYYKTWEKANNKFDEWTSPRYYETNNRMIDEANRERKKKESLEKRRQRLRTLLEEEAKSHEIELTVKNRYKMLKKRDVECLTDELPTEVLKDINVGLKIEEDRRRRREAELSLYFKWRRDNPILRDYERNRRTKDMKLTWLDQQIEKRMEKERAEEECRKLLEERNKRLEAQRVEEEKRKHEREEKDKKLAEELAKQVDLLKLKQKESEELRKQEDVEVESRRKLLELEEAQKTENRRRAERECALENVRQYKMKLKQKAIDMQENIRSEKQLLKRLIDSEIADSIENQERKEEIKIALRDFLAYSREQEELEKQRQKYLGFVFDSEAKVMFDRQNEVWMREQEARGKLLKDVLDTIRSQIDEKIERNVEKQKRVLEERDRTAEAIEEYNKELNKLRSEAAESKITTKNDLDRQLREKKILEQRARLKERKTIEEELERVRKEEERLKREILNIQRRQQPIKPTRSRLLW